MPRSPRLAHKATVMQATLLKEAKPSPGRKKKKEKKRKALYLCVNVFRCSTKVLIGKTICTSPTGDGTAILCGHPSHAKV